MALTIALLLLLSALLLKPAEFIIVFMAISGFAFLYCLYFIFLYSKDCDLKYIFMDQRRLKSSSPKRIANTLTPDA